ncbi:MAG TPA: hypothetical protein VGI87_12725 [Solirubrobacteraceae bacterium]|jgi:hypothetical protein
MMRLLGRISVCALPAALFFSVASAVALPLPGAPRCPIFPRNNPWNQQVENLPTAPNSSVLIQNIGLNNPLHPGFGSGMSDGAPNGIPINVVSNHTPTTQFSLSPAYSPISYHGRVALPAHPNVQGGNVLTGDRHLIVVNKDTCKDYEFYGAVPGSSGWAAQDAVVFNLRSNALRPPGWTSANAAGTAMLPGLVRYDEVRRGVINHALWFAAPEVRAAYVYPAVHDQGGSTNPALPPLGLRVRMKRNVNIRHLPRQARIIAVALKRYGMILTDEGMAWWLAGAPNAHWNNRALQTLWHLTGSDFEVVNTSSLPHPGL